MDSISQFWANQAQSFNRDNEAEYYRRKACEHADILSQESSDEAILDLGCGAGELLEHLLARINVSVGLDYSASMLDAARQRLEGFAGLELVQADVFDYLSVTTIPVWMTTGALNQYLDSDGIRRMLDIFKQNASVHSLYLFDCVDPLRYRLWAFGMSYLPERPSSVAAGARLKKAIRRFVTGFKFSLGRYSDDTQYLGSPAMGYGQLPRFWLRESQNRQLMAEVVSSRYYEYRYHVRISKEPEGAG